MKYKKSNSYNRVKYRRFKGYYQSRTWKELLGAYSQRAKQYKLKEIKCP